MDSNIEKKNSFLPSGWTKADTIAIIFAIVISSFVEWFWYIPTVEFWVLEMLGSIVVFVFAFWVMRGIILKFSQTESK